MKIHLHIGTHKTGTSAIQAVLYRNREFLLEHGIYVPEIDDKELPGGFADVARSLKHDRTAKVRSYIERWVADAERIGARCLLISSEEFSTAATKHVEALARILSPFETQVILYLRNVHEFAISVCGELIKKPGGGRRYDSLVHNVTGRLDYTKLITRWEACFGDKSLDIRCYDNERATLLEAFYTRLGVPEKDLQDILARRSFEKNKSIDLATQAMLSVAGIDSDMNQFFRSRKIYEAEFADFRFGTVRSADIARAFCRKEFLDFSHPRLEPFVDVLSSPMPAVEMSEDTQVEYLERLGTFALRLATERRGHLSLPDRLRRFLRFGRAATERLPEGRRGRKRAASARRRKSPQG
jgi:hypothetical protein